MTFKNSLTFLIIAVSVFSCTVEDDVCSCYKEMVTKESGKELSKGCAYIHDMKHAEIELEAGEDCIEEIKKLTYNEDEFDLEEDFDENAMMEGDDFIE